MIEGVEIGAGKDLRKKKVTVVVPVFNEEWSIAPLWSKLSSMANGANNFEWKFLFVDDGSSDESRVRLDELAARQDSVQVVLLKRNCGVTQALQAGFDLVEGDYVVTIPANLEYEPDDIPKVVDTLEKGADSCVGSRTYSEEGPLSYDRPLRIVNWIISALCGLKLTDYECMLRGYRAPLVKELHLPGDLYRYLPAYLSWQGRKIVEVDVEGSPRSKGWKVRKRPIKNSAKALLDLVLLRFVFRYSARPFYIFGGLSLLSALGGVIAISIAIFRKLFNDVSLIETPLPLLSALFFLSGMLLLSLGILAEFLLRIYRAQIGREFYEIQLSANSSKDD